MGTDKLSYSEPLETSSNSFNKTDDISVQKETEKQEKSKLLPKINDILDSFAIPEEEDKYRKILLNTPLDILKNTLSWTNVEIKQFLIKQQIKDLDKKIKEELTKGDNANWELLGVLQQDLDKLVKNEIDITIAVEKQETLAEKQETKLKNIETEKMKEDQNIKIAQLRGVLLWNPEIKKNPHIEKIEKKFDDIKWTESQEKRQKLLDEIMEILKTPWTLESVAKDLGWVGSEEYVEFKSKMLQFEPSLQEDFDRVEMNVIWNIAKLKLWTSDLEGVDLDKNILSREEDGVVTSYSDKKGRYLSSVWGDFSLKSELNPDNEKKLGEVNSRVSEDLEPLNESLNLVNKILEYLRKAEQNGEDFEEVKMMIKTKNPDFYADEWLDNITSLNEMIMILNARKYELEEEKEDLKQEAKEKIARIIQESEKEAEQKDKMKKDTLKFLHSIGFDMFANSDVDWIIRQINISKWRFGLSEDIDLAKWNLGTVYGWENNVEKKNFARIVNILFSGKSSS